MTKKAVELSMNAIIIAAIALIVLVVLVVIFTGQGSRFSRGVVDCEAKGGDTGDCTQTPAQCIDKGGVPAGPCVWYNDDGVKVDNYENWECCLMK